MKKSGGWKGGLKKLEPGKWAIRVTWMDGDKRRDTERVVLADTRNEAVAKRLALVEELTRPSTVMTVTEATDSLVSELRAGTRASWSSHANKVRVAFGERRLDDVRPDEIRRFLAGLPISDSSARSVRTMMVCVWEHARDLGRFDGANPVKATNPRKTPRTSAEMLAELESPPLRAFHGDELGRFLAAIPAELRALLTVQLLLGCRFGEASALQWSDVDTDTGRVRIVRTQYLGEVGPTKGKRARWTSLGPGGIAIVQTQRAMMEVAQWPGWETWCFPRRPTPRSSGSPLWSYRVVASAVRAAKLAIGSQVVANTHALRHTFVTTAEAQRIEHQEAVVLRSMLGHASAAQTAAYTEQRHLPADPLAARIERALVGPDVGHASKTITSDAEKR